jgi:periplasmic protein TonB
MMFASDLLEPPRTRRLRWTSAAVLVVAAHVGATAMVLLQRQDDQPDSASAAAVVIEMAAIPVAPRQDTPDVAHGPLMEEAKLTPPATTEKKEVFDKEIPPIEESPAPKPDVVLPAPRPAKEEKPDEQNEKAEAPQQSSEQATAVPLTTAPPRIEASETPAPAAPAAGSSAVNARALLTWEKSLVSHLNRFKRYPEAARTRHNQGEVSVEFTLDRTGRVVASRVVRSSGSRALDDEALAVLQRASPLPAPPAQVAGATFDLRLPIEFRIR